MNLNLNLFTFCESKQANTFEIEQVKKILHNTLVAGTVQLASN